MKVGPAMAVIGLSQQELEYMLLETGFRQVEIEIFEPGMALLVSRK